jgi:hypothetical protein
MMATLRRAAPDPDAGRARAVEVRRQADVQGRWFPNRAAWLRHLADGYEAGVLDPAPRVWHPGDGPAPADYVAAREASAAWMIAGGFPALCPNTEPGRLSSEQSF